MCQVGDVDVSRELAVSVSQEQDVAVSQEPDVSSGDAAASQ